MTFRRTFRYGLCAARILCFLFALAWLSSCSDGLSPEDEIRLMIEKAERAAEERDLAALLTFVSDDYIDDQGNSKQHIRGILVFYFRHHRSIHILYAVKSIELASPDVAEVGLAAALAGQPISNEDDLAKLQADLLRFEIVFRRENGDDWRVTSAKWEPAGVGDFVLPWRPSSED